MDMKEKLVELIQGNTDGFINPYAYEYSDNAGRFADHLIAHGVTVQEWISVKDRLPEVYMLVLALCKNGKIFVGEYVDLGWRTLWRIKTARDSTKEITQIVTHWMPLPEPPKEETQPDCTYNENGHCIGQKLMPECDQENCDRRKH